MASPHHVQCLLCPLLEFLLFTFLASEAIISRKAGTRLYVLGSGLVSVSS